jgi:PEP-CTERM motif
MSTGRFVTGLAAALVVSVSVVSAASDDNSSKSRNGSHEVAASTYSATFPHGAMCASGSTRASRETLSNPFASFNGAGAYAAYFFRAGFNAGVSAASVSGSSRTASFVSMPSSNHGAASNGVKLLPPAANKGITTALAHGTPAVGTGAELASGVDVASPSATPEPATLLLITTGIGGVFVARRRRNRTSN